MISPGFSPPDGDRGAYLVEIFSNVVVKGGADAVVGLGFEIYVAETNRTLVTVEDDLAWAVSNDLIDVVLEDTNPEESLILLSVHDLEGLLIPEGSDTWISSRVRVWLTEQGAEFLPASATSFPLISMSAGKPRLIRTPREKSGEESRLGPLRWAPKHRGFLGIGSWTRRLESFGGGVLPAGCRRTLPCSAATADNLT